MTIFNLFSKRQKKIRGDIPDVYLYDDIPSILKVQIVHIWKDTLGNEQEYYEYSYKAKNTYKLIIDILCREYGLFELPTAEKYNDRMYFAELSNYFIQEKNIEKQLDIIELSFKVITKLTREYAYMHRQDADKYADNAIDELNNRFQEHGIGFQFIENEIIKVDSEFIHAEVVKPALRLLNKVEYRSAQQEFLSAYQHYRHGKNKESLNDCLKSFESTMKIICDKHKWHHQPNDNAKKLIKICFDNKLIPSFWQQQLTSLQSMLESSIPTGRNKLSAHGQGIKPIIIPDYLVSYMLHMTASTLVFLTTAEKNIV